MMQGKAKETQPREYLTEDQKSGIDIKITALLNEVDNDKDKCKLKEELCCTGIYRWLDNFVQKHTSYDYSIIEIIFKFISCTDKKTLHKLLKILAEALGKEIFVFHILKEQNVANIIDKPFVVEFLLKDQYITFELLEKALTEFAKEKKEFNKTCAEDLIKLEKNLVKLLECLVDQLYKEENEDISQEENEDISQEENEVVSQKKQLVDKLLHIIKQTKFTDTTYVDQDHEIKQKLDGCGILSYKDEEIDQEIRYLKCVCAELDEVQSLASEISTFVNQENEGVVKIDLHDICLIIQCAKLYNLIYNTVQKDASKAKSNIILVSEVASPSKTTDSISV